MIKNPLNFVKMENGIPPRPGEVGKKFRQTEMGGGQACPGEAFPPSIEFFHSFAKM